MASKNPELDTIWANKTREDAIVDANKLIDERILRSEQQYFKTENIEFINKRIAKFNNPPKKWFEK